MRRNEATLYLLVGLPGSGKSTLAAEMVQKLPNAIRLCPESIAKEYDESIESATEFALKWLNKAMLMGYDVIYDASNLTREERKEVLRWIPRPIDRTVAVVLGGNSEEDIEKALAGNSVERKHTEPEIIALSKIYEVPEKSEGILTIVNVA